MIMNTLIKKNTEIDRAINEFRAGRPIIINKDIFFTIISQLDQTQTRLTPLYH